MSRGGINKPHDALFRYVMSDPANAASHSECVLELLWMDSGDRIVEPARRRRSRYRDIGDTDNAAGRQSGPGVTTREFQNTLLRPLVPEAIARRIDWDSLELYPADLVSGELQSLYLDTWALNILTATTLDDVFTR